MTPGSDTFLLWQIKALRPLRALLSAIFQVAR